MTTTITITTNGNYVSEGLIHTENEYIQTGPESSSETYTRRSETFKVGPGSMVSKSFTVPHGSEVTVEATERDADPDEIAEVTQPKKETIL